MSVVDWRYVGLLWGAHLICLVARWCAGVPQGLYICVTAKQYIDLLAVEMSNGILIDVPDQQTRPGRHQGYRGWCGAGCYVYKQRLRCLALVFC